MLRQGAVATPDDFPDIEEPEDEDPWEAAAKDRAARFDVGTLPGSLYGKNRSGS